MGKAGKQMGGIAFSRPGSSHRFAIDSERIGRRSLAGGPNPCREDLFKALDSNLRQQPAREGPGFASKTGAGQRSRGSRPSCSWHHWLTASLLLQLTSAALRSGRPTKMGDQSATRVCSRRIRDGFQHLDQSLQMRLGQQVLSFLGSERRKDTM
jgi:hypothetical protein